VSHCCILQIGNCALRLISVGLHFWTLQPGRGYRECSFPPIPGWYWYWVQDRCLACTSQVYIPVVHVYVFWYRSSVRVYHIYLDVKSTVNLKCRQYITAAVFLFSLSAFSLIHISSKTNEWCPNTFGPVNYAHVGCVITITHLKCAQFRSPNVSGQQQLCVWVSLDTFKLGNWVGMRKEMQQDFCLAWI
jgi:hypothetical protein